MQSGIAPFPFSTFQPILSTDFVPTEPVKKKRKKRSRDDANAEDPESDAPRAKKKKRKHRDNSSSGDTPVVPTAEQGATAVKDTSKKDKKKKKKDKGKGKDTSVFPAETLNAPDPQMTIEEMDEDAQASTAALLSAIVAAATAGAPPEIMNAPQVPGQPIDPQFGLPIMALGHPPFIPMPPPPPYGTQPQPIPDPSSFANMGLPFSDLSFGSNEDVLRALQDLDITKIANVLKTLGEAAAAANVPPLEPFQPASMFYHPMSPPVQPPTPVGGFPAPSNAILGIPPKKPPRVRVVQAPPSVPEQHGNPDHATLLSTRWLGASKLAELVRTEGLVYKKGKFSAIEEQALQDAIKNYCAKMDYSDDELQEIIFPPKGVDKKDTIEFWQELTAAVPLRPIIAVYHHIRRTQHPLKQQGKWSAEEDARLKQAVVELGQQWEKVSLRVGRMSSDCRDRYRNHIQNREVRVTGPWSKEEEIQLTQIVTDMTIKQGKDIDNDVFWGKVSEHMGGRRGRQQCRIKWTDALSKTIKNEGEKPRWSQQDAFILVHKVDSLGVRDDTEIDWKTLADPDWNLWSAHTLQRRWLTMKRSIKGHENMTHSGKQIMDILRVKKAHLPLAPLQTAKKRKERKVTSAAAIPEGGDVNSSADATRIASENSTDEDSGSESDSDEDSDSSESSDSK
ncbi:DNA-binding protein REB1 [Leucoagaricus sp. SymC.cos]|nr:DNA-binding protein REB1 [Leucoagaricus sp. SymC.cos]